MPAAAVSSHPQTIGWILTDMFRSLLFISVASYAAPIFHFRNHIRTHAYHEPQLSTPLVT
jgi:hypothetical protein